MYYINASNLRVWDNDAMLSVKSRWSSCSVRVMIHTIAAVVLLLRSGVGNLILLTSSVNLAEIKQGRINLGLVK